MNHGRITGRRPYQHEALANVVRGFKEPREDKPAFRKLLIELATGGGKTVIFTDVAAHYAALDESVLVLCDQRELVNQAAEKMLDFGGLFAEIEQGTRRASPGAQVVVGSMQSMAGRLDLPHYHPKRFKKIIVDEADRSLAPQWQKVLAHFDGHAEILGLTATPERADKKSVLDYYEDIVFRRNLYELIGDGYLSPVSVRQEALKIDLTKVATSRGAEGAESDYKLADVGHILEPAFDQICELLVKHAKEKGRRKVLAFLPLIETSKKFVEACFRHGINARHVDGNMPNRDEVVEAHKRGDFWLLSNAMMLNRGYDDPVIDTILPLRFTKSASLYRQMIGRGTRLYCPHRCAEACEHADRKKDVLIFDFLFEHNRLGPQRPANLIAETPEQAAAITKVLEANAYGDEPLDLEFANEEAAREREVALLKALEKAGKGGKRKGKTFDAREFAIRLKQRELIDYEPLSPGDSAAPTEKQISALAKWGVTISSVKSRGHASKLLSVIFARQSSGMASLGQVRFLNNIGDPDAEKRSRKEAAEILDRFRQFKEGTLAKTHVFPVPDPDPEPAARTPAPTPAHASELEEEGGYDQEDEMDEEHLAALVGGNVDREEASQPDVPAFRNPDPHAPASPERAREAFAAIREKLVQGQLF